MRLRPPQERKTPRTKAQQKQLVRAIVCSILLLATAGLAIALLSSPSSRDVFINGELERFSLPTRAFSLSMPEINTIHLRKFALDISRIASLDFHQPVLKARVNQRELTIKDAGIVPASAATLRPLPRNGQIIVTLPPGTVVAATTTQSKALSVEFSATDANPLNFWLESDKISIDEADRGIIDPKINGLANAQTYSLDLGNTLEMVHVDSTCIEECRFDLSKERELPIVKDNLPMKASEDQLITLGNLRINDAIVYGAKDSELVLNAPSDLTILPGSDFVWTSVSAIMRPDAHAFIAISGHGKIKSLVQNGRQVLPSEAAELFTADPAHRGIYGGVLLLFVFGWGLLFKRGMDLIAKSILPE